MPTSDVLRDSLLRRIYNINEKDFDSVAMEVFRYQYAFNPLYQTYCDIVGRKADHVSKPEDIPFLPILFFRDHIIRTGTWTEEVVFRSSGTTSLVAGQHFIRSKSWYHAIASRCFSAFFGPPASYVFIGLLPSYLERPDSSLVSMVNAFMEESGQDEKYFFRKGDETLISALSAFRHTSSKVMLIGVSFALLDFFEQCEVPYWDQLVVMETGGMKGRGKEITRAELYERITRRHPRLQMSSEYGMTELMSQAYRQNEMFRPGPTMRVLARDISDPLSIIGYGQRGGLNIMDLGNLDTCAFIATDDAGMVFPGGQFEVLGRLDASDVRGCNLMYTSG